MSISIQALNSKFYCHCRLLNILAIFFFLRNNKPFFCFSDHMTLTVVRFSQHRGSLDSTISNTSLNMPAGIETNLRECCSKSPPAILTCKSSALLPPRWNDRQLKSVTVTTRDARTGGGLRVDVLVLAGVLPHGVWRGPAVHSPVPGDSKVWHQ